MYESLPCSPKWSLMAVRSRAWIQDAKSAASKSLLTFASVLSFGDRARRLANQTVLFISSIIPAWIIVTHTYLKFAAGLAVVPGFAVPDPALIVPYVSLCPSKKALTATDKKEDILIFALKVRDRDRRGARAYPRRF